MLAAIRRASSQTPGGMRGGDVTVGYEITTDPTLRDVVRRGEATTEQAFAYVTSTARSGGDMRSVRLSAVPTTT
jgi:hypothetical protein